MDRIPAGVYPARELVALLGRATFDACVREGTARLLRRGWYAIGSPPADVESAVRRGGVLTCMSALKTHGVWVPEHHDLHVRGSDASTRTRRGPFCTRYGRPRPVAAAVDDLPTSLEYSARCLDREGFVVVCDSIMNLGLMTREQIERLFMHAPRRIRVLIDRCDGCAQSGLESIIRFSLGSRNVKVRTQVSIPGVGQVDMVVGDYLIIEADGREWHWDRFDDDRARDIAAHALGFTTLRFSRDQILYRRDYVMTSIMEAIAAGVHRRPARLVKTPPQRVETDL